LTLFVMRCSDLLKSCQFYQALGLALTAEQHKTGPEHYSAQLGATVLELYPATTPPTPTRLGFAIIDVAAAVAKARSLGASIVRFDDTASPSALLRDPDGNTVELTTAPT